jgi:hypothetical protein
MLEGIDKEYYEAVCIAEEMWEWLADNPLKGKSQWPKYKKYNFKIFDDCSICRYKRDLDDMCGDCFLSYECKTTYPSWVNDLDCGDEIACIFNATQIYFAILEERLRIM